MTDPAVSVVLPVYDGGAYLAEAIDSVLGQRPVPFQVVVVDDGSTDGAPDQVAQTYRTEPIVVLRQPRLGPAAARNRGLTAAQGDVVAFVDADDLWPPGKLAAQVALLAAEPGLDVVAGLTQRIAADSRAGGTVPLGEPERLRVVGCCVCRRSLFDRLGGFDERLVHGEDEDFFLRIDERAVPTVWLRTVTLLYRMHPHNMSRDGDARRRALFRLAKNRLDRRRAAVLEGGRS